MSHATDDPAEATFEWVRQPAAAALVKRLMAEYLDLSLVARQLRDRNLHETGTRLVDWVDYIAPPTDAIGRSELLEAGFEFVDRDGLEVAEHAGGMFPTIRLDAKRWNVGVKVESVADFLNVHGLKDVPVEGDPWAAMRMARVPDDSDAELWVIERHGYTGFTPPSVSAKLAAAVLHHEEAFRCRKRRFDRSEDGFAHALELVRAAADDLGTDRACDVFFHAEREFWMSRNRAGRLQRSRQDRLGLGWGNHDHHTYRSSREHFHRLVELLEAIGLHCRERFYAGVEAGWGAQVMEQPACRLMVFADVDLSPDEVTGDFAHQPLAERDSLGTVGLWCKLHGEAALEAGMHHLEAQFDFDAAREQVAAAGIATMAPFTDFPFLKQAFTQAEIWPVEPHRIAKARTAGWITDEQAELFTRHGALGSHLEILERNEGYKGFNQTGISHIIRRTDPRGQTASA
jgi:hypothetical protein